MERAAKECGGIHSVLIDGIGDLCVNVNDPTEANELHDEIRALVVKHSCPVVCVLHENPAAPMNAGKTRGHLGSHLERKAESNLRVKKDANEVSAIFSDGRQRGPSIPESIAPRFKYCEAAGMHMSCEAAGTAKADAARAAMEEEVAAIYDTPDAPAGFTWKEIHQRIREVNGVEQSGARKRFEKLVNAGLIKKNTAGLWIK